jgi:hypothetical protein
MDANAGKPAKQPQTHRMQVTLYFDGAAGAASADEASFETDDALSCGPAPNPGIAVAY